MRARVYRLQTRGLWRGPAGADRRTPLGRQGRPGRRLSGLGRLCLWRRDRGRGSERDRRWRPGWAQVEAVVQNQDNREHDLLDSDDYYQFEGGACAAVEHPAGPRPAGLSQRPFPPRTPGDPHAGGRDRPRDPLPRRQSEMDRGRHAPRLQGRVRNRGDASTIFSPSPPPPARSATIISTWWTRPSSRMKPCATSSPPTTPRPCARSRSGWKKP